MDLFADKIINTKVVGVTFDNEDGTNRQEILKKCIRNHPLKLEREPTNKHDPLAIKVLTKNGQQLGYIKRHVGLASHMDVYGYAKAKIKKMLGGKTLIDRIFGRKGKKIGCLIEIRQNGWDSDRYKRYERLKEESNPISTTIKRAKSLEKSDIVKSIGLYADAIEKIIEHDKKGSIAKWARNDLIPINRITLLLERNKQYKKALEYLKWYKEYPDFKGLYSTDRKSIQKREERLIEKMNKVE